MTIQQNQTFLTLLQSWNNHQDLRDAQAPIAQLATSRFALDDARLQAARHYKRAA